MSASREAIYAAGTAEQQHNQHTPMPTAAPGTAGTGADAEAMDVDSGEAAAGRADLQQLMSSIRSCLKQLQGGAAAGGQGQAVQDKLVQLQQQAALLCM
jgi:hypothetical protein